MLYLHTKIVILKTRVGWEVLILPDEEVGSIASSSYLETSAKNNDIGLLYEPALPDGSIVKSRKGVGSYTMVFRGVSAHAGRAFNDGLNAFYGVSDFINWSKNMMEINKDLIINLGKVEGGEPNNVVPDLAIARFNARVSTKKQRTEFEHQLEVFNRRMRKKVIWYRTSWKIYKSTETLFCKSKTNCRWFAEVCKAVEYAKNKIGCNWWSK